ncbi:hypothetical protein AC579_112 [Pseudocercospora musae]|uniref:Uncharacterized protein n=1 Tax=Pseudocercospora musae TaxID=113226 RepID=A0A139HI27_9PEZI|nr:hypothetical protein AC579_112 [Pseudocercospora musae]
MPSGVKTWCQNVSGVKTWCQNAAAQRLIDLLWLLHACLLGGYDPLDPAHTSASNHAYRYLDSAAHLVEHTIRSHLRATPTPTSTPASPPCHVHRRPFQSHRARLRHSNITPPDLIRFLLPRLLKRIILPCLLICLVCRWRRGAGAHIQELGSTTEPPHPEHPNGSAGSAPAVAEACLHTCTSPEWLHFSSPAHPQVLWLSPKTPDFAPDWLQRLYLVSDLRSDGATFVNSRHYPKLYLRDVRELAVRVRSAASIFLHGNKNVLGARQGVREPLNLHRDTINAVSILIDAQSNAVYRFLSSLRKLHIGLNLPRETQVIRHLMSWSANTSMLDGIAREYRFTSSLIGELRTQTIHNVDAVQRAIAQKQDVWAVRDECQTVDSCFKRWQPALDDLRDLSALADFIELNLYVTWHMLDAVAFFTRILLQTLNDDDASVAVIKQVYGKRRLQAIMSRAGLYAARKWATQDQESSDRITSVCHKCLSSLPNTTTTTSRATSSKSTVWQYWWTPYPDDPAAFHHFREPPNPLLAQIRGGSEHTGRRQCGFPVHLPDDWRQYKSSLSGEECLGIDHLFGDEMLDERIADVMTRMGISVHDLYNEEQGSHARNSIAYEVLGEVWCVNNWNSTVGRIDSLGYASGRTLYWETWVKGWRKRSERRNFVHEAWGES